MTVVQGTGGSELGFLHGRLAGHFEALQLLRASAPTAAPIFALEHGLSEAELLLLKTAVCSAVRRGHLPRDAWLPFVVYATEVGYEYSGDEYWQTFEARTPGWAIFGDRHYIRRHFVQFKTTYSGAEPSGAWARHFSIICWPITHAVLPNDLQRHLAQLLFESRRALTSDLLHDPDELGRRLAARAWQASSRFQNFAQNTELLGRVASALLLGDDDDSPYLLTSTLRRIVGDLEQEREARRWLRDAKSTASHVRTRGFRQSDRALTDRRGVRRSEALAPSTDPELSLRRHEDGWAAYVEFPDLSVLGERFPPVRDELNKLRAHVGGAVASPLARGRLLYGRQRLRLKEWPASGIPLVQLEGGSAVTNSLLAEQCFFAAAGPWLFRIRDAGEATEVRGRFVRPGHDYVLLSRAPLQLDLPTWISEIHCTTAGAAAYSLQPPAILEGDHISLLERLGVGAITEVEIRPTGYVPALWDGEGTAEWFVGERPMLALSTTRHVSQSIFSIDSSPFLIPWPQGPGPLLVSFDDLSVGVHSVDVALIGDAEDQPVAEGKFQILVRPPATRPTGGTLREGLMILPTPVNPSLEELWDGKAVLEIHGPTDVDIALDFSLFNRSQRELGRRRIEVMLPLDGYSWLNLLASTLREDPLRRVYDDAEFCEIAAQHGALGRVSLRAEREFVPLRWASGQDHGVPFVRLIDNTEGNTPEIEFYEFERPDRSSRPELRERARLSNPSGGLAVARSGEQSAAVILPRTVRRFEDLQAQPRLQRHGRSVDEVVALLGLARSWGEASLTANPIGPWMREKVLSALARHIATLICGGRWADIERRLDDDGAGPTPSELQQAVGQERYQAELAGDLARQVAAWADEPSEVRAEAFGRALGRDARRLLPPADNHPMAGFLLRLASQPAALARWPAEELPALVQRTIESPVLLRAARFVVVAVERQSGVWTWQ